MASRTEWMAATRAALASLDPGPVDAATQAFFTNHYAANRPTVLPLPRWPALAWSAASLRARVGAVQVEVQTNRLADPDYEIQSHRHRETMRFDAFLDRVESGPGNDIYMTAQNHDFGHCAGLRPLFADLAPLPAFLMPQPEAGFLWIGGTTMTPLHHDLTNNYLAQIVGRKHVRLLSPQHRERVDNHIGVHSRLGWLTDEMVAARGLDVQDVMLEAGQALFLPVGWWHCVQALSFSITALYTSFIWPNNWTAGFS